MMETEDPVSQGNQGNQGEISHTFESFTLRFVRAGLGSEEKLSISRSIPAASSSSTSLL